MDSLIHRIVTTAWQATIGGIALGGVILFVHKLQMSIKSKSTKDKAVSVSHAL